MLNRVLYKIGTRQGPSGLVALGKAPRNYTAKLRLLCREQFSPHFVIEEGPLAAGSGTWRKWWWLAESTVQAAPLVEMDGYDPPISDETDLTGESSSSAQTDRYRSKKSDDLWEPYRWHLTGSEWPSLKLRCPDCSSTAFRRLLGQSRRICTRSDETDLTGESSSSAQTDRYRSKKSDDLWEPYRWHLTGSEWPSLKLRCPDCSSTAFRRLLGQSRRICTRSSLVPIGSTNWSLPSFSCTSEGMWTNARLSDPRIQLSAPFIRKLEGGGARSNQSRMDTSPCWKVPE
ncbi:UNVERIFIED_CONTAM: hypothetical protein FKN15_021859 [Acipenser sinensis]